MVEIHYFGQIIELAEFLYGSNSVGFLNYLCVGVSERSFGVGGGVCEGVCCFVLQEHVNDRWQWLLDPTRGYSVRGTYHFLTASDEVLDRGCILNVWHRLVPLKIYVFA